MRLLIFLFMIKYVQNVLWHIRIKSVMTIMLLIQNRNALIMLRDDI